MGEIPKKIKSQLKLARTKVTKYHRKIDHIDCDKFVEYKNTKSSLIFSIKGSCDIKSWITNATFGITTDYHPGWSGMAKSIILEYIDLIKDAIDKKKLIYILGYSLGAAITAYIIFYIKEKWKNVNIKAVIFGSPRSVPNRINNVIKNNILSLVDPKDLVTYIPFISKNVIPGIIYVGKGIYFTEYSDYIIHQRQHLLEQKIIPIYRIYHKLSNYINILRS